MSIQRKSSHQRVYQRHAYIWLIVFGLFLMAGSVVPAYSQSDDIWDEPLNLSQSGAASEPQLFVDGNGNLHAIWQDTFAGYMYTRWMITTITSTVDSSTLNDQNGQEEATSESSSNWERPRPITPPFGTRVGFPDLEEDDPTPLFKPVLVANSNAINAWWIGEDEDLFFSRVNADEFATTQGWQSARLIQRDVVKVVAAVDISDTLHIAYVGVGDTAGIYYQQSSDAGTTWTSPILLFESAYFRQLPRESINLQLISKADRTLFIAWDDPSRERVYLSRTIDNGESWAAPFLMDERTASDSNNFSGPKKIKFILDNDTLHLFWINSIDEDSCTVSHSWSTDDGDNWKPIIPVFDFLSECPADYQPVVYNNQLFIFTNVANQSSVSYFDSADESWSLPHPQPILNNFISPDTFRIINYSCSQSALTYLDKLIFFSCGEDVGQDIWLVQGDLASFKPAITEEPVWSEPVRLTSGENQPASPMVITDNQGRVHVFWIEKPLIESGNPYFQPSGTGIYYIRYNNGSWSQPIRVISSGAIENFAVTLDKSSEFFFIVWRDINTTNLYFSQVSANRAQLSSEWSQPLQLPVKGQAADPDIIISANEQIYIAYAIEANENRGLYLVSSSNRGESWSEPIVVLNDTDRWETFSRPRVTSTAPDNLHLIWTSRDSTDTTHPAYLYYVSSRDGGQTWSEPLPIRNRLAENRPILWYDIQSNGAQSIHLAWQEWHDDHVRFWYQQSLDDGFTWNTSSQIFGFEQLVGSADLKTVYEGQVYLSQIIKNKEATSYRLEQWLLNNSRRESSSQLLLENIKISHQDNVTSALAKDGELVVIFSGRETVDNQEIAGLFSTERLVNVPSKMVEVPAPSAMPTVTPAVSPTIEPTITSTPIPPQSTIDINSLEIPAGQSSISSFANNSPLTIGTILAATTGGLVIALLVITKILASIRKRNK